MTRKIFPSLLINILLASGMSMMQHPMESFAESSAEIEIAVALGLTGPGATFGTGELNAITLAVEEVNAKGGIDGKKVKLTVEDTQTSNVGTLSAYKKLTSINHAKVILGPTWLDSYQGLLPIATKDKVVLLTPSAAITGIKSDPSQYPLVFSTYFSLEQEVITLLNYLKNTGKTKLALVFDQDLYYQAIRGLIKKHSGSYGIQITFDDTHGLEGTDFKSNLLKLKASPPDSIFFGFGSPTNTLSFLKQKDFFLPEIQLVGTEDIEGYLNQPTHAPYLKRTAYFIAKIPPSPFQKNYAQRFGTPPSLTASNAYDAANILFEAYRNKKTSPEEIRDFILTTHFSTSTFGDVKFNALGGIDSRNYIVKEVKDGVTKEVEVGK